MAPIPSRRSVLAAGAGLAAAAVVAARAAPQAAPFSLPALRYEAGANAAAIDAETMQLHHGKHHRAYVDALNAAIAEAPQLGAMSVKALLRGSATLPEALRATIRDNAGGHANHTMFWEVLGGTGGPPSGAIAAAIDRDLGGWEACRAAFEQAALAQFGAGWVFVTVGAEGRLSLVAKANQDSPLSDGQDVVFGNDVWEHAYYLRYRNRRADYVRDWWSVLDWDRVNARLAAASDGTLSL